MNEQEKAMLAEVVLKLAALRKAMADRTKDVEPVVGDMLWAKVDLIDAALGELSDVVAV